MSFTILGEISKKKTIAAGRKIRTLQRLVHQYGPGRWRKMKGKGLVMFQNGAVRLVELHWYEAHGIGRKEIKIKYFLDK